MNPIATEVPLHVVRLIENVRQEHSRPTRSVIIQSIHQSTFCEPNQAIDWVDRVLANAIK